MPRVSIIIPSYNHARFLDSCFKGIQNQTFQDWEIILIDDGSTDGSVERAREFARGEPRLQVHVNEKNLGTYGTEQRALDMSKAEFVAILNSDDLWAPEKLEAQINALEDQPDVPLAYVLGWKIDDRGQVDQSEDVHFDWPTSERQEILPYLLYENRVLASGVLFRREGLRFETTCRYSGDWVALLDRSLHSPVACVPERLNFWRMHDHNTFRFSVKQVLEEIRVREAIHREPERWFQPRLDRKAVERGLALNAMNLFTLYIYFREHRAARQVAWAAVRFHPQKRSPLKRAFGTFLPNSLIKKYFWHMHDDEWKSVDVESLREGLRSNPPLYWNRP